MQFRAILLILFSPLIVVPMAVANENAIAIVQTAERSLSGISSQVSAKMVIKRANYSRLIQLRWWAINHRVTLHATEQLPLGQRTLVWLRDKNNYWHHSTETFKTVPFQTGPETTWIGTDFELEQMMGDADWLNRFDFKILRQERDHTLIECRAKLKTPDRTRILYWTRRRDGLPMQKRFLNDKDEPTKTIDYSRFRRFDDRLIPTRITVTLRDKRQSSVLIIEKQLFDRVLPLQLFDPRILTNLSQTNPARSEFWFYPRIYPSQPTLAAQRTMNENTATPVSTEDTEATP